MERMTFKLCTACKSSMQCAASRRCWPHAPSPLDTYVWQREDLESLLGEAIDHFEMLSQCNDVGSEEWVWLHRSRMALGR